MIRRSLTVIALIIAAIVGGGGMSSASAAQVPPAPVGPECNPGTASAVLASIAGLGLPSKTKIQYLEVYQTNAGTYAVRPCVVTVP